MFDDVGCGKMTVWLMGKCGKMVKKMLKALTLGFHLGAFGAEKETELSYLSIV